MYIGRAVFRLMGWPAPLIFPYASKKFIKLIRSIEGVEDAIISTSYKAREVTVVMASELSTTDLALIDFARISVEARRLFLSQVRGKGFSVTDLAIVK